MQNILIDDAASGIGAASTRLFHRRGQWVGLLGIDTEALCGLAAQLPGVWQCAVDISGPNAVGEALVQFCADGCLHPLFNYVGILRLGRFEEVAPEDHARLLAINLQGVLNCHHAVFPFLRATPWVRVLSMGSASGLYGMPEMTVCSTSKFVVCGLAETLKLGWHRHGIRIADSTPPFTRMPMAVGQTYRPPVLCRLRPRLDAEDVAEAVQRWAHSRQAYRPASGLFATLYWAGQLSPPWVNRAVMAWLSQDEQVLAFIRRLSGVLADTTCGGIRPIGPGNANCHSNSAGRITARGYPPLTHDIDG